MKKLCLQPHLWERASSFEVLAVLLWRARTVALPLWPDEEARLLVVVSVRKHSSQLGLPPGYYGFACTGAMVAMAAGALLGCSLGEVVEQVWDAKASSGRVEYVRSMADHLVLHGRPPLGGANMFLLSDVRHIGFHRVDFGWGEPVYAGPSHVWFPSAFIVAVKGGDGKEAVAVPVALPRVAMDRFVAEIESLLKECRSRPLASL